MTEGRRTSHELQIEYRARGGIGVEIPFMSTTLYTGPAASAMNGTDLSWIVGLVITVPLYYLLAVRQVARHPAAAREPARN
jgi:trigonelline permease